MSERKPPLTPYPLEVLLGRVVREWESRNRIFDLPTGRFFRVDKAPDLSFNMGGRQPATLLGPAAGPHTQLAQNFVLGWLAGARVFECKTVQILDELDIGRPCIDLEAEGYNIEWSQELSLEQSLVEYVKAWMMLEILTHWSPISELIGSPGDLLFDLSVGYDLEGIKTERVDRFIRGMMDATEVIDALRPHIPPPFESFRDHPFEPVIGRSVTLSTFHGCPPEEIEGITKHLIDTYDFDVIVKLNPTLLGFERVQEVLHQTLGYQDVTLDRKSFDDDLQFERALAMIPHLNRYAIAKGRKFGVKLTNTLVVRNEKGKMPDELMYLSGRPLHVITTSLLNRLHLALPGLLELGTKPGPIQVSFSAGVEPSNVIDTVGLGLRPVTVSSILLKPLGYGQITNMLKKLQKEMERVSATNLAELVAHAEYVAQENGHNNAVEFYAEHLVSEQGVGAYRSEKVRKKLREVDNVLELWGCVSCNLCITVCPNDAMLHLPTPETLSETLTDRWQYFCVAELCNDCGNCTTFCPEEGAPFLVKPRLYIDRERFLTDAKGPAFLIGQADPERFSITPVAGMETEVERLSEMINAEEGFPLRPTDLPVG